MIWPRWALWLLTEELPRRATKHPRCTAALADVASLYREWIDGGKKPDVERWVKARRTATATAATATAAAVYAAAATAADAARQACIVRMSDKLIELLEAAR